MLQRIRRKPPRTEWWIVIFSIFALAMFLFLGFYGLYRHG